MRAVRIANEFWLALRSELHTRHTLSDELASDTYLVFDASVTTHACPVQDVDEFCTRLSLACDSRHSSQQHVLILTENTDDSAFTSASMFLGSFLILRRGLAVSDVLAAFQDVCDLFVPLMCASPSDVEQTVTVQDCWCALDHALRLGWFVPSSGDDEPVLDVGELVHYARTANGGVQIVVPGALLLFPTPSEDVPEGQEWADSVSADGRPDRRFSAAFYASLLADLGVSAAACLGRGSAASARAFAARGVAPVNLRLIAPANGAGAGALLPALDHLLTLARGAPGAVALHCGAGGEWPAGWLGTLAVAFLISRLGFSGAEAAAWVHMVASDSEMLRSSPRRRSIMDGGGRGATGEEDEHAAVSTGLSDGSCV